MNFLFFLIVFFIFDFVFFAFVAFLSGLKCGRDCSKCKNWACTSGGPYEKKGIFPVINWSFICKGGKNG